MKNLMIKELKLVVSPSSYFFALCGALVLVPAYPYSIGMFYCLFSILITFGTARANNDHLFTAMLPVSRDHIVLAKHFDMIFPQMLTLLIAIPCAIISTQILNKSGNIVGMDANIAFFGLTLTAYGIFNIIFLPWYFKTGYKVGWPMAAGIAAFVFLWTVFEITIHSIPSLAGKIDSLDPSTVKYQLPVLLLGIIIYFGTLMISYRRSIRNFEKVSL